MPIKPDAAGITIRDREGALGRVHAWLQAFMRDKSFSPKLRHDLTLITEELLVNSLQYGAAQRRSSITISAWLDAEIVWLEFQDSGEAFNPLDVPTPDLSADISARQVGGLGIHLIRQLADHLCYRYQDGVNRLRIGIALRSAGSP